MLHRQTRALLDLIEQRGLPPTHTLTPAEARRYYRERRFFTQPDAPEFPFPHAVDDCLAATYWTQRNAAALAIDATRIAVGGDSAGGNLAAVVTHLAREAGDLPNAEQFTDPRASPLLHDDLTRLPPAFVLTAGYDPLRDEGLQYSQRLSEAGNRVMHVCFERQIHGFVTMGRVIDEAHAAVALRAGELRRALGT